MMAPQIILVLFFLACALMFFRGGASGKGYYAPLITPTFVHLRHLFWSNFHIHPVEERHWPMFGRNSNERETMLKKLEWFGFDLKYEDFKGIPRPRQIVDNCVAPYIGQHVLSRAISKDRISF